MAVIAAHYSLVEGKSLGKHDLIIRFLKDGRRLNPSRPRLIPSWYSSLGLSGLQRAPFELLELRALSLKMVLLTMLISNKRVGDLQVFSVSELCLELGPGYSHIIPIRLRSHYP